MSRNLSKVRTPLAKAKGLGSAHDGAHHWFQERIVSVASLFLCVWFIYSVITLLGTEHYELMQFFGKGYNAVLFSLFIIINFHHAAMGLIVVVEDYVHSEAKKMALIILIKFGLYGLAFAAVLAIAKMHFAG